jgi:predicted TIM-barrel fold metal-dependent hydrolase
VKLSAVAQHLCEQVAELPVIDAHEHLPSEKEYLDFQYSGLNLFAGGYIWHDLESAGLPSEFKATMRDGGFRPVDDWWPKIRPYWDQVKHSSYARALRITVRDVFGLPDIDDSTIVDLADAVQADNRPGLFQRILRERCGIRTAITCIDHPTFPDDPILRGITKLEKSIGSPAEIAETLTERTGRQVRSMDDAIEAGQSLLRCELTKGAIGFKIRVAEHSRPDPRAAEIEWKRAMLNPRDAAESPAVRDLLFDSFLDVAAEADVPVAVHTGYWDDFRELDPKHMFSFAARRRDVRFDMFHLGMPMIRDAILIGKTLPNVTLNLTWCPIVSQEQTVRALDEIIDLVPLSKVIAFGGDYRVAVHKVYGHLVLAREAVAMALARRVEAGDFDHQEALRIARMWFYDNPVRIYALGTRYKVDGIPKGDGTE